MRANYVITVYNSSGNLIADISDKRSSFNYSKARNRADEISLSLNLDVLKRLAVASGLTVSDMLAVNENEIRVYRDGTLVTAGQIAEINPLISGDERTCSIKTVGWLDLFKKRHTAGTRTFTATDQSTILWTLINESQSQTDGNFGVTLGTLTSSIARDRTYEYKNIYDAIVQMTEVINGMDVEITPAKVFNTYYPKIGSVREDIIFNYPGNIQSIGFTRRGSEVYNRVIARGGGFGQDAIKTEAVDTALRSRHKLREEVVEYSDVSKLTTLQQHADKDVADKSKFNDLPEITLVSGATPEFGTYGIGDVVQIQINEDYEVFSVLNSSFTIEEIKVDVTDGDVEDITIGFS